MLGGYNVVVLIKCLKSSDENIAKAAAKALENTIFLHDYFNDIVDLAKHGNKFAKSVIESYANAKWF